MISLNGISTGTATTEYLGLDIDLNDVPQYHPGYGRYPLPLPPAVRRPDPLLGRIVWPVWGASRYAVGHLAVNREALNTLTQSGGAGSLYPITVQMKDSPDSLDVARTLTMYCISVRHVSDCGVSDSEDLILTLVDRRYWTSSVIWNDSASYSTWGDLLRAFAVAASAGVPIQSASAINTLVASYGTPPGLLDTAYIRGQSLAFIMDAACSMVNLRPVFDSDGNVRYEGAGEAEVSRLALQTAIGGDLSQGGTHFRRDVNGRNTDTTSPTAPLTPSVQFYDKDLKHTSGEASWFGNQGWVSIYLPEPCGITQSAYKTKYIADALLWQRLRASDSTFGGLLPLCISAAFGVQVWEENHTRCHTRLVADPPHYPWPLAGDIFTEGAAACVTTTTTTPNPTPCTGTCRWDYSPGSKTWSRTSTTCSTGCKCLAPAFCPPGYSSSVCAFTPCGLLSADQSPLNCTGTTTTPGPGSSCTTTTSTGPPGTDCLPCNWYCEFCNDLGPGWIRTNATCTGNCGCGSPQLSRPCDWEHPENWFCSDTTPCVRPPIQTPVCSGSCFWIGVPTCDDVASHWVCDRSYGACLACTSAPINPLCYCDEPVTPPVFTPACGASPPTTVTNCYFHTPGGGSDPCFPRTTPAPGPGCTGKCLWGTNNGTAWNVLHRSCVGCACETPVALPTNLCQQTETQCTPFNTTTTTTTTPAPPTTTTTTTTTTTVAPGCVGTCIWSCICAKIGGVCFRVLKGTSTCESEPGNVCRCADPVGGCVAGDPDITTVCGTTTTTTAGPATTTTTAAPTTTTTAAPTTTTTAAPTTTTTAAPTTTTTAAPTTTTTAPCPCGVCVWTCGGAFWTVTLNTCTGGCDCTVNIPAVLCNSGNVGATTQTCCGEPV